jgi:hypothetical protein
MRFNRYIALALTFVAGASSVLGAPRYEFPDLFDYFDPDYF